MICPKGDLVIGAITGAPAYRVGSQPVLGLTVTNSGKAACVRNLSGTLQTYTVYTAGGERVWSTSDCFPGTGTEVRMLGAGQTVTYRIKWAGTTSTPGCATPRVHVKPGSYTVVAALGSIASPPKAFTITG